MLNNEQNSELIDGFLKGNLSPAELSLFEENLRNDASFKSEVELQQSIVNTLKANRKAELKQRLNEIDVNAISPSWWKYAAVLGVVSTIGLFLYFDKTEEKTPQTISENKKEVVVEVSASSPKSESGVNESDSEVSQINVAKEEVEKSISGTKESAKTSAEKQKSKKAKEQLPNLPKLHSPEGVAMHEALSKELDAPDHSLTKTPHLTASVAGVEVVKSKKHKFHYRYFDKKLFLYGNFDTKTYDILELNTSKGQSFYLKFEQNYYSLESNKTEISKLEQVKDREIVKELDEIQK